MQARWTFPTDDVERACKQAAYETDRQGINIRLVATIPANTIRRMFRKGHGEGALRRHRFSTPGASYFLTLCTEARQTGLTSPSLAGALRDEIIAMEIAGHWRVRAAVIMPDHLHLLAQLVGTLSLSKCVGRFKSKTKSGVSAASLRWQANFYEHKMRPGDEVGPVLRYLLQNPVRVGVCALADAASYPWFWLGDDERAWFTALTDDGAPLPKWLAR